MTTADTLDRGRESFGRRAWADAVVKLSAADRETPLAPEDLERLAIEEQVRGRIWQDLGTLVRTTLHCREACLQGMRPGDVGHRAVL